MTSSNWLLWFVLAATPWPASVQAQSGVQGPAQTEPVTVFGAASLTDALTEIGSVYRALGHDVRFSFAASSTLARQIEAGAPAAIFASASVSWMDYLQERGLIDADSRISPIGNALVLITPAHAQVNAIRLDNPNNPEALDSLLGKSGRLAMGDPAHVPAGMYAKQALQALGSWHSMQSRLAFANNVRGVLALVERGEVPAGIVYATDAAISDRVTVCATFPPEAFDPIRYSFALVAGNPNADAAALLTFMSNAAAGEIFRRHGFLLPSTAPGAAP